MLEPAAADPATTPMDPEQPAGSLVLIPDSQEPHLQAPGLEVAAQESAAEPDAPQSSQLPQPSTGMGPPPTLPMASRPLPGMPVELEEMRRMALLAAQRKRQQPGVPKSERPTLAADAAAGASSPAAEQV